VQRKKLKFQPVKHLIQIPVLIHGPVLQELLKSVQFVLEEVEQVELPIGQAAAEEAED